MDPLTLYPSKLKWGLIFFLALLLAGYSFTSLFNGSIWSSMGLLILSILAIAISLHQMQKENAYLMLSEDGFEYKQFWRTQNYAWHDIRTLSTMTHKGGSLVTFTLYRPKTATWLNRLLQNMSVSLPDSYGMKAEALQAIMEEYRAASTKTAQNLDQPNA